MDSLYTIIGIVGVVVNLTAYGLITSGRLGTGDARYQLLNIFGTCGLLISLIAQWNLPSFIANVAWLMIGIIGLIRILYLRRRAA